MKYIRLELSIHHAGFPFKSLPVHGSRNMSTVSLLRYYY